MKAPSSLKTSFDVTSLITNTSAMSALQTLRQLNAGLNKAENQAGSGLRIAGAKDSAAYWSIATTMRSDKSAVSAASDALNLGAATVDVAYEAMTQTQDALSKIRSKLVTAMEPSVDKAKVQGEISQLAQSTVGIAASASFNGVNWLDTNVHDLYESEPAKRSANVVSSFVRNADGTVSVNTMPFDLINTSLYNEEGGGILQGDPRSPLSVGGLRFPDYFTPDITNDYEPDHINFGVPASLGFEMPHGALTSVATAITFSASDTITFDLTLDGDNPAQGLPGPLNPGQPTPGVTINQALVVATLGRATIYDATEMSRVLNAAFAAAGVGGEISAGELWHYPLNAPAYPDEVKYSITTGQNAGLDGSEVKITNFQSTLSSGNLGNGDAFGSLGSSLSLTFEPFKIYKDVSVDFTFGVNNGTTESHVIDRDTINSILGTTDGWVNTADDMVKVLKTLITRPNTVIEANGSQITVRSDPADDRTNGSGTAIGFTGMSVNIEPIPMMGLLDMDIEKNPGMVNAYIYSVNSMLSRVTAGAAALGSLKDRLDIQAGFAHSMIDQISSGVGRLVDADMENASTHLAALQTQQQLAIQSLSIANSTPQNVLSLFRS
jgi:flagellin-like hook-associated protein FlgL